VRRGRTTAPQPYSASAAAPQSFLGAPAAIAALPHSYSQPNDLYAQQMNGFGQPPQAQQQAYGYGGGAMQPGLVGNGALAPLPGTFGLPSTPQFTVQSVQATQRAHAAAAAQVASDPFAHIQVSPQPAQSQSQTHAQPASSPFAGAVSTKPKQPGQCEADGCEGKSVSRGLCIQHVRGPAAGAAAPAAAVVSSPLPQASAASSFDFLATQSPPQQQQQPLSTGGESSSFAFLL
jgi:hypothetical protein